MSEGTFKKIGIGLYHNIVNNKDSIDYNIATGINLGYAQIWYRDEELENRIRILAEKLSLFLDILNKLPKNKSEIYQRIFLNFLRTKNKILAVIEENQYTKICKIFTVNNEQITKLQIIAEEFTSEINKSENNYKELISAQFKNVKNQSKATENNKNNVNSEVQKRNIVK